MSFLIVKTTHLLTEMREVNRKTVKTVEDTIKLIEFHNLMQQLL
jgi:hypothetical protein